MQTKRLYSLFAKLADNSKVSSTEPTAPSTCNCNVKSSKHLRQRKADTTWKDSGYSKLDDLTTCATNALKIKRKLIYTDATKATGLLASQLLYFV